MAEPRWLDPAERAAWLATIGVTLLLPTALDAQLQRDAGLTHFDFAVLVRLSEAADRTLTMSELAGRASASLSRLSHVMSKLEKRGWVRRRRSAQDARATLAELTEEGHAVVVAAAPAHVERVRSLVFDALDHEEVAQLGRIAAKVLTRLDPEHRFAD